MSVMGDITKSLDGNEYIINPRGKGDIEFSVGKIIGKIGGKYRMNHKDGTMASADYGTFPYAVQGIYRIPGLYSAIHMWVFSS